jgi:hypothetical protein
MATDAKFKITITGDSSGIEQAAARSEAALKKIGGTASCNAAGYAVLHAITAEIIPGP